MQCIYHSKVISYGALYGNTDVYVRLGTPSAYYLPKTVENSSFLLYFCKFVDSICYASNNARIVSKDGVDIPNSSCFIAIRHGIRNINILFNSKRI